jgi:tetratricopeptide (TPR) repeat protein
MSPSYDVDDDDNYYENEEMYGDDDDDEYDDLYRITGGFNDDDEDDDDDYDYCRSPKHEGYTRRELEKEIKFLRPDYSEETGEFDWEGKDVRWCLDNGFEEVATNVWSGPWYWRQKGGEPARQKHLQELAQRKEKKQERRDRMRAKLTKTVPERSFQQILVWKQKGNAAFGKRNYVEALGWYTSANDGDALFRMGIFLGGVQREEKVKILSNMAECHLRLKQYQEASMVATEALTLDKRHDKSLIRRAKATFWGVASTDFGINPMAIAQVEEDLQKVIMMKGEGVQSAKELLKNVHTKIENELENLRSRGFGDSNKI